MKKPRILTINAESAEQKVADGWQYARQRDFSGGESLATLPEKIGRNQLIRMVNAIISPEGQVTDCWQMDKALFTNVSGGIVIAPIPGSPLFRVYGASGNDVISFVFDPASPTAYDMNDATGYPGYTINGHASPTTILGITHGTPFLGKNYCCASINLYLEAGEITTDPSPVAFGTVQMLTVQQLEVTITNETLNPVELTGAALTGANSAMFGHDATFPQTVAPAGTYTFAVTYNPTAVGAHSAVIGIGSNLGILNVAISGTAEMMVACVPDSFNLAPALADFGHFSPFYPVVTNSGTRVVTVTSIYFTGENASDFRYSVRAADGSLDFAPIFPLYIAAGGDLGSGADPIVAAFDPTGVGTYYTTMCFVTDVGTIEVPITGTGV